MRNDPVDMGKLIKALEVSMIHDLPITLVPREAKKLRGELLAWERMVGTLLAEREKYREKYRWVSVEERLPEMYKPVLTCYRTRGGTSEAKVRILIYNGWFRAGAVFEPYNHITHWMPLPEPPESEEMTDETDELDSRMEIVISIEAFGEDRIFIFPLIKDKYTDKEKKSILSECLDHMLERYMELLTGKENEA